MDVSLKRSDWETSSVGLLGNLLKGVSYKKDDAKKTVTAGNFPILRANNIVSGALYFEDLVYVPQRYISDVQFIKRHDIIFCMSSGSKHLVGKSAKAASDFKGSCGAFCALFRPLDLVDPNYLAYFFQGPYYKLVISEISKGTNINNLKREHIVDLVVPLPPLPEQRHIVAKIGGLFSELDKGVETLKTLQQQLKIYRQAVLKAAFAGKLTEKVQSGNWPLVCLRDIAEYITDGDHQPPPKSISGIPFITISNIDQNNRIDFSQSFYVDKDYYHRLKNNRKPRKGDVLYTVTGSYGIPVLIDFDKEFCFQRHIGLIRPQKGISSKWLYYLLQSPAFYQQALRVSTGTAQKTIPLSGLRSIVVPFMTSKEQEVLVSEIESRLSVADIIEETIKQTLQQSEALRQSILKKAFEGRLLSAAELEELRKEPDWEPASVLLEKIKAQKAAVDTLKLPAKKSARKGKKQA